MYDYLIRKCAECVQREVLRLVRRTEGPLRILEVGYGTGALTKPLLEWANALNATVQGHDRRFVGAYIGIDSSHQMQNLLTNELEFSDTSICEFHVMPFGDDALHTATDGRPVDVVCGSLVLHEILSLKPDEEIVHVLRTMARSLSEQGCLVFADVFRHPGDQGSEIAHWKQLMGWIGLDK